MSRPLTVFHPLPDGAAAGEVLTTDPGQWLPGAPRHVGPDTWELTLTGAGTSRRVRCHVGPPWRTGTTRWRTVRWEPASAPSDAVPVERLLPTLQAELGVVDSDTTSLVLDGVYDVPGGPLGELVDAIALHRIARRTATGFLAELADRLLGADAPTDSDELAGR